MNPNYIVGIDLGTTHTVVAYAALKPARAGKKTAAPSPGPIQLFEIEQLVAPGEVAALALLPSARYHAAPGELAAASLQLPWPADAGGAASDAASGIPGASGVSGMSGTSEASEVSEVSEAPAAAPAVIGELARRLGAQTPGRLVASAKSWLSHAAVDRLAPILPWGAPPDVPKVSPVEASASYLRHVRAAWDARFPQSPLAQQELVLTVPASFDEAARALTLQAARLAGLPALRLLEEPQAAFYDWLQRHRAELAGELAATRRVLVCDVGGGTTDLSLIDVDVENGQPRLTRIGVGNHLMLGGDNMDLALAHAVEARLNAAPSAAPGPATGASGTFGDAPGAASADLPAASNAASGVAPAPPLSASRLAQLMERCRVAKELLLSGDAPEQAQVTLLGSGARLVGGSRSVGLARADVERLIVDGFFPQVGADAQPRHGRSGSGIVAFGLPYARDAAITRHIAEFLRQHGQHLPDTLLLNGGVFRSPVLARRLADTLAGWRGAPLRLLHNDNPDVAVARGAVAYGLARRGLGPRIGGGSARSYFLRLDEGRDPVKARGICVLPRGSQPGREVLLEGRTFALRVGQPVRFHLLSSVADRRDVAGADSPPQAGELVALDDAHFARLPPIVMVLQPAAAPAPGAASAANAANATNPAASAGAIAPATDAAPARPLPSAAPAAASGKRTASRRDIAVQLAACLTEVGTLEMHCIGLADPGQRWLLEFDLRHAEREAGEATPDAHADDPPAARLGEAIEKIDRIFGSASKAVPLKDVRQLRQQLEKILGAREGWSTPVLRRLFDALWQRARGRQRSAEHLRVWLNLAGYCLRPGFGDALDGWRLQQLWPLFEAGVQHGSDRQVCAEWWTLWRRVAGGLDTAQQLRLLQDFAFNLQGDRDALEPGDAPPVKGSEEDMLRLGASLERIPADYKAEIGDWLLGRLHAAPAATATAAAKASDRASGKAGDRASDKAGGKAVDKAGAEAASDSLTLWALGRIGARQPFHGSSHDAVAPEVAARWLQTLLGLDWKRLDAAAFAAVSLARVTDDRTRDLAPALRGQVLARLAVLPVPPVWLAMVRERVELDAATERRMLGESLPPGLKLLA